MKQQGESSRHEPELPDLCSATREERPMIDYMKPYLDT